MQRKNVEKRIHTILGVSVEIMDPLRGGLEADFFYIGPQDCQASHQDVHFVGPAQAVPEAFVYTKDFSFFVACLSGALSSSDGLLDPV